MNKRIYLSPPHLDGEERSLLLQAFDSNWITTLGPHVDAFEKEICNFVGMRFGAALSSGTAALHLALLLLGIGPGDRVICSDLTFVASANPILYLKAEPVFIDSERTTWNMDPDLLDSEIRLYATHGRLPKAVIAVDLYGQCADYEPILEICGRYDIPLIEDAAEALGASYKGKSAGRFGAMSVLSFNGNKIITTSGGGMLVSNDESYVKKAKFLSRQARNPTLHYEHSEIGYNYRMSNLLAAVGRGQLARLDAKISCRKWIYDFYKNEMSGVPGIDFMPLASYGSPNFWLTVVQINPARFGADREAVRLALEAENIESRPVWKPMHMQPVFLGCHVRGGAVAEDLFVKGLCLPSGTQMTSDDLNRIVSVIKRCHKPS